MLKYETDGFILPNFCEYILRSLPNNSVLNIFDNTKLS